MRGDVRGAARLAGGTLRDILRTWQVAGAARARRAVWAPVWVCARVPACPRVGGECLSRVGSHGAWVFLGVAPTCPLHPALPWKPGFTAKHCGSSRECGGREKEPLGLGGIRCHAGGSRGRGRAWKLRSRWGELVCRVHGRGRAMGGCLHGGLWLLSLGIAGFVPYPHFHTFILGCTWQHPSMLPFARSHWHLAHAPSPSSTCVWGNGPSEKHAGDRVAGSGRHLCPLPRASTHG